MSVASGSNPNGDLSERFKSIDMKTPGAGRKQTVSGAGRGRELPQSPADIARSRTLEFMSSLAETPTKVRRLDIANRIRKLESERCRVVNRIKKVKQRMRELHKSLTDAELECVNIDREITTLRTEYLPNP